MKITSVQIDPAKLHKTIVAHFSLDEIRTLCLDLSLDFDELPPGGKSAKARGLVEMCQRQRRLVPLAEAVLEFRPNLPTNQFLRDIANDDAPFKGLLAFEEADEEIFFGREELTAELVARVHQPPAGSFQQSGQSTNLREVSTTNFLAIVGASGSGKSSVVRAGMIPQLRRQTDWPIHLITPTTHPLQALATSLTRDSESIRDKANLIDDLEVEPRSLRLYAAKLLQFSPAERLLLVIDQFEELFTLCKDETERAAFVENLVAAVADDGQITILLTLRADFYAQCLKYDALHRLLEQQQKIVPTMSSTELRAAIELPAQQANLTFADGLVDILLRDVGAADNQTPEPGALPLLSHALLETWQRRDPAENRLTLAGYTEAGGVQGAIAKTAESTYQRLPTDQQKIARSIFLRLTELGEGTQDTRRRAALAELLPQNDSRHTVAQVLKTLADARLLTTSDDGAEVAHEALIRQWPTLQSWLDEDRIGLRLHHQLAEAARSWNHNNKDVSYLYQGERLAKISEWQSKTDIELNFLEQQFLFSSEREELKKAKGLIGARTAIAWMGMTSNVWRHDIEVQATNIRDLVEVLLLPQVAEFVEKGILPQRFKVDLKAISSSAEEIFDNSMTPLHSAAWSKDGAEAININELIHENLKQLWKGEQFVHLPFPIMNLTRSDKITVWVNPEWLWLAVELVIDNGIESMKGCKVQHLYIETAVEDDTLEITLRDTGRGIPPEVMPIIFDALEIHDKREGNLLRGLLIVQAILQTYEGKIYVKESSSSGTQMVLNLPIYKGI
ncbi:MAG: hypothetical protein DHS20C20_28160 [Ardenticatenaceae bacterium]|nr:MAG: hypothetical protein DHS20C20_28160 [Ardenticatenaceae bacterium]